MMSHDLLMTLGIVVGGGLISWGSMKAGASFATKEISRLQLVVSEHVKADDAAQRANFASQLEFTGRLTKVETLLNEIHRAVVK